MIFHIPSLQWFHCDDFTCDFSHTVTAVLHLACLVKTRQTDMSASIGHRGSNYVTFPHSPLELTNLQNYSATSKIFSIACTLMSLHGIFFYANTRPFAFSSQHEKPITQDFKVPLFWSHWALELYSSTRNAQVTRREIRELCGLATPFNDPAPLNQDRGIRIVREILRFRDGSVTVGLDIG